MNKLKEKDKKLLVLLAVFVIAVITLTQAVLPMMENRTVIEAGIAAADASAFEMDSRLAVYDANKAASAAAAEERAAAAADFYNIMENEAIDRLITGIVLDNGLEARDLTINSGESPSVIMPYYVSGVAAASEAAVYVSSLSLRAEGTESRLLSLIDLFTNDYPAIRVAGYSIKDNAAGGKELNLSLELYMCEK